jgi:hypothetical protein
VIGLFIANRKLGVFEHTYASAKDTARLLSLPHGADGIAVASCPVSFENV